MREIAILLPYKENFTENSAGAASIWVKDYLNKSNLKSRSTVYGYLSNKSKPLLRNFKNLKLGNSFVKKNISYTDKLYKEYLKYNFKIIEIHNRPESLLYLIKKKVNEEIINVFVPTTPNPTSGFLLMVPKKDVIYLDVSFEQASKFIVSAGTTNID